MRIAALSDFHIGSCHLTDSFLHDERTFLSFLANLECDHDRVVLLGDIFQAEHGALPGRWAASRQLERARARVPGLCRRIERPPYTYIHGNHDSVAQHTQGALTSLYLCDDGFSVFFIHGHQFDPTLRHMYPIARAGTWLTGRLRRARLGALAEYVEHKDVEIKNRRLGGADGPYAGAARALLSDRGFDCVVMGHTHVSCRFEWPEGVFANTGTCSRGQISYVSIDTRMRRVEVNTLPQ